MNSTTPVPEAASKKPGLLINRNFALLWSGRSISLIGDYAFDTTLILWIATIIAKGQSWGPLAVSGVLLATTIPMFVVGPIAGVFVDRWNKRHTMLWMDAARAILIALLLLATNLVPLPFLPGGRFSPAGQIAMIYIIVFLASICAQFFNPSRFALIGDLVPEEYRARASGLTQVAMSIASIIGPPIAAPLLLVFGVQWALIINALSFVASFLAILAIRAPRFASSVKEGQPTSFFKEFAEGIRFFLSNRVLVTLLVTVLIVMLGGGALNALNVFFVTGNLHTPAKLFGLFDAVMGIGIIVGAILASAFAQRLGVARTFWVCTVLAGALILVISRLSSFAPALVFIALVGIFQAGLNVAVGPLLLHVTPRELVGRVSSVIDPMSSLASIVSVGLAGILASTALQHLDATLLGLHFGPIDTIFTGTGFLVVLGGLYAMVNLRGVTLAGEKQPAPAETAAAVEAPVSNGIAAGE
jgi:MFS family permease